MAYRSRRRWSGRRDVFPLRVAAGGLALFALLITVAVWAVLPAASDGSPDTVQDFADAGTAQPIRRKPADARPVELAPPRVVVTAETPRPTTVLADAPETFSSPAASVPVPVEAEAEVDRVATTSPRAASPPLRERTATPAAARVSVVKDDDASPRRAAPRSEATVAPAAERSAPPMRLVTAEEAGERGTVALSEGRFGAAAVHYQRAITLEPRDAEYRTGYARALFHHGALPQAARQLEQAVVWNPRYADAWALLGEIRWAQDDRERASEAYQRYLELESNARLRASAEARLRQINGDATVSARS